MEKYFILLFLLGISLTEPSCVQNENFCEKCNIITNLCFKCQYDVLSPDENGGCLGSQKCIEGKNYCKKCYIENNVCSECPKGLFPDENGGCSYLENCAVSYRGKCLFCQKEFILAGQDNENKICKSLDSDDFLNCKQIDYSTGYCKSCNKGYYLNKGDKKCTETENCDESIFGQCISCILGFYLDHHDNKKCKFTEKNEEFLHCKETEDGKTCSICEDGYYFDENNKCVNMTYCSQSENFICTKCITGFYLTEEKDACTKEKNCLNGDNDLGVCITCKSNYYLDLNDRTCNSNQKDDDLKFCKFFNGECTECESRYELGKDNRCSTTKNCDQSKYGQCAKCSKNYYLGIDGKCTNVEHCITSILYSCTECDFGYYYSDLSHKCELEKEGFENCKITKWNGKACSECRNNFYLSSHDNLCYSNEEEGPFYKCALSSYDGNKCEKCIKGYYLGSIDNLCSKIENCGISKDDECIECSESYCLDIKKGSCERNDIIKNKDSKKYYKCKITNEESTACEVCMDKYTLSDNGFCVDYFNCEEEEDGVCIKCKKEGEHYPYFYCLNKNFGCIETYYFNENCLICDDDLNFNHCDKCKKGYKFDDRGICQ